MSDNTMKNHRKERIADSGTARRHRQVIKVIKKARKPERDDGRSGRHNLSPYELKAAKAPPPCPDDGYVGGEKAGFRIEKRFRARQTPDDAQAGLVLIPEAEQAIPAITTFCFDQMAKKMGVVVKKKGSPPVADPAARKVVGGVQSAHF